MHPGRAHFKLAIFATTTAAVAVLSAFTSSLRVAFITSCRHTGKSVFNSDVRQRGVCSTAFCSARRVARKNPCGRRLCSRALFANLWEGSGLHRL